jgi:thiosulfate reductase cytochrome b subunit
MTAVVSVKESKSRSRGHAGWVRVSHWILVASVLTLSVSGTVILMSHPRLYWGKVGNDLTPALFELPISRNYKHGGWDQWVTFGSGQSRVVSAARTYDIFNQNSWARSLHFLGAWFLILAGSTYCAVGLLSGHLWRHIVPRLRDLTPQRLREDIVKHLQFPMPPATGGPPYGVLQKLTYAGVLFAAVPLMVLTGLTMSPAVTAAYPSLLDLFGGSQSARTLHFFTFAALMLFLIVHVAMVVLTGFRRQLRAMTFGS